MSHHEVTPPTVGARIAMARGELQVGQFAELLGVNRKTVTRWEAGMALPDGQSLLAMWTVLKVSPEWVLTGGGAPPSQDQRELALLARYRSAPPEVQAAVMRALESKKAPVEGSAVHQAFHGSVGQVTQGDAKFTGAKFVLHDERKSYGTPAKKGRKKP